jgi:hypothetical protein
MNNNDLNPLEVNGTNVAGRDSISEFRNIHMTEDVAGDPTAYAVKVMLMLGIDPHEPVDFSMTDDNVAHNKAQRLTETEMELLIGNSFEQELINAAADASLTEADLFGDVEIKSTLVDDEELACYIASLESQNLTEDDLFTGEGFSDAELDNLSDFLDSLPNQELTEEELYHFEAAQDWCRNILENADSQVPCSHGDNSLTCLDCFLEDN